jgi:hypothetical protein
LREAVFAFVGVVLGTLNFLGREHEGGELEELGESAEEASPETSASVTTSSTSSSSEEEGCGGSGRDFLPLFLEAEAP